MPTIRDAIELAMRHHQAGRLHQAEAIYRKVLEARPNEPNALHMLGLVAKRKGRNLEAIDGIRQAIRAAPKAAEFHANLGTTCLAVGLVDEAMEALERAVELKPDFAGAHSNLLIAAQYRPGVTLEELDRRHRAWNERHAAPLRAEWTPHENDRDPERPLRLGFVSPDLWQHPVGIFLVGLLEALDPSVAETVVYNDRAKGDHYTERLRAAADTWRDTGTVSDPDLARTIRDDRVDVLFELAGHTARHRLLVMARKPAPLQATWMGYVGTTGLDAIDFLIADPHQVPAGAESHFAESVLRLPHDYVCFDPPADAPPVAELPALAAGHVTFGCFNNPSKLNPAVIEAWSRILKGAPEARLLLKYRGLGEERTQRHVREMFAAHGIGAERVEMLANSPRPDLLATYGRVDVGLDPFPYSGGLTTLESLWMGVPVLTAPGETFASRHSMTHDINAGAPEFVADDVDDYVARAVAWTTDLDRLATWRRTQRERMAASPACDAAGLACDLLAALRPHWRDWCRSA